MYKEVTLNTMTRGKNMTVKDRMLSSEDALIEGIIAFSLKMLLDNNPLSNILGEEQDEDLIIEKLRNECSVWLNKEIKK